MPEKTTGRVLITAYTTALSEPAITRIFSHQDGIVTTLCPFCGRLGKSQTSSCRIPSWQLRVQSSIMMYVIDPRTVELTVIGAGG